MEIICPVCKCKADKSIGSINRAKRNGLSVYCSKKCAGLKRRKNRTSEEKKKLKSVYDKEFRTINVIRIKKEKSEYHKRVYDPKKAAIKRKKNMPRHVEYCRQPEYKKWKSQYDKAYKAKKSYGDFWECRLIIASIEKIVDDKEARRINNLQNKLQKRKKLWNQRLKQSKRS